MMVRIKKQGLLLLAFLVWLSLNYNPQLLFVTTYRHWGWQSALLATFLILIIFRWRDPAHWKEKLGVNFSRSDWIGWMISTVLLLIAFYFLVSYLAQINGYEFRPKLFHYQEYNPPEFPFLPILGDYIYYLPATFNEEIFMGALLLMGLERHFKYLDNSSIAIGVALVFCLMHQVLYHWSPVQPGQLLTFLTLLSLFFVGLIRNVLILKTRKIAYAWAIHLSFNLIFFSGFYIQPSTGKFASEPERFNLILGNWPMVIITGILASLSLFWLNRKAKRSYLTK